MFDLEYLCDLSSLEEALYEMEEAVNDSQYIIDPENKNTRLAFFRLLNVLHHPSTSAREMTRRLGNVRRGLTECAGYEDSDLDKLLVMACVGADAVVGYYHARGKHDDRS